MGLRDKRKLMNILAPIIGILGMIGLGLLAYFSYYDGEFHFDNIFKYFTIGLVIFIVLLFILGPIIGNNNIKKIKSKYEQRRFKFIDTFYYKTYNMHREMHEFKFYHIIQDVSTNKYYGIFKDCTNSQVEVNLDDKVTVFVGQGLRSNWQRVSFGEEGSFWIKEELADFYKREGSDIIINFDEKLIGIDKQNKEEPKNNVPLLKNSNPDYDISLLDDVTFIDGLAEFDIH